jgi:hypothetical protein
MRAAPSRCGGEFLFTGRRGPETSMTTRHYVRLVSDWIGSVGLDPRLFGHTKIESTFRYLGIEVDDALAIAEQVDV